MDIVFIDIETSGLDPNRHAICEIGAIAPSGLEFSWALKLSPEELKIADTMALKINHYYDRILQSEPANYEDVYIATSANQTEAGKYVNERQRVAEAVGELTAGCILAGNNVKFYQQFLEIWLRKNGVCPTWDYHVLDVPTYAAGYLAGTTEPAPKPPFGSRTIGDLLAIPEPSVAHTALGYALWSKAMYEACK